MARDVFVSYSTRSDKAAAFDLLSRVEARGIECWIAPRDVRSGMEWAAEIVNAISACRVMVLILSSSSNQSPQVRNEVTLATARGVHIVPVRIEDVPLSPSLAYFLSGHQWLDAFPPPLEPHYAKLCTCLNNLLATPDNPPPKPERVPIATPLPAPHHGLVLDDANLRRLESALAVYIGPFAKIVVDRAAAGASSVDGLLRELGDKIESEPDRKKFLTRVRSTLTSPT